MRLMVRLCHALPILLIALTGGCGKTSTSTPPNVVKCRVVIALKPGETVGDISNNGCRLNEAEVREYMSFLNQRAAQFGTGVAFDYNDTVEIWDSSATAFSDRPYSMIEWLDFQLNGLSPDRDQGYDVQAINIYFGGWVEMPGVGNQPKGFTVDPAAVGNSAVFPHIFISDRAFHSNPGGITVSVDDRVLEHEMGHFLLRQMQNQGGRYDQGEHDPNPNATHLMKTFAPHGKINNADFNECSLKVVNNRYLQP